MGLKFQQDVCKSFSEGRDHKAWLWSNAEPRKSGMQAPEMPCRLGTGRRTVRRALLLEFTGDNKPLLQKRKAKEIMNSHTSSPAKSRGEMALTVCAVCCL